MTRDEFWAHIKATKRRDPDSHVDRLIARLAKLPPDEILDFGHWWDEASSAAYRWDLWGAAYLMNGGCSDDGFIDFRSWLILQGREVYEAALNAPDSLADLEVEMDEACCECYPASDAWFQATGKEGDYEALNAAREVRHPTPKRADSNEPDMGENWDFDDDAEMRRRLPRLATLYLEGEPDNQGDY
jgi:hypothetical protein